MNKSALVSSLLLSLLACRSAPLASPKYEMKDYISDGAHGSSAIPARREFPVNPQISPCEDFYMYACSKVNQSFKLPEDRSSHTFAFDDSSERLLEAKKTFFKDIAANKIKLSPHGLPLKPMYASCMNTSARGQEERVRLKKVKAQVQSLKDREAFLQWFAQRAVDGKTSLFDFDSTANQDQPEIRDVLLSGSEQVAILPERSYFSQNELVQDFRKLLLNFYTVIEEDRPDQRAQWLFDFAKGQSEALPLPSEFRQIYSQRNVVDRQTLVTSYPNLKLQLVLERLPPATKVRLLTAADFKYLNEKLGSLTLDQLRSLALFLELFSVLDESQPKWFAEKFAFEFKYLGGPEKRADLQERCTRDLMYEYRKEIDFEMVDRLFPNFSKEKFLTLLERVRSAIIHGIEHTEWLSQQGRQGAIEKIKKAHLQVVRPETEKDWDFRPILKYSPQQYLANKDLLSRALVKKVFAELSETRNPNRWMMGPLTVNAYYSPEDNKFVMPIGILQYPFYDPAAPDHVNLGAVGAVVGHELGHGIDDQGSKYDAQGKLKQWMTDEDVKRFKARGQMLIAQFDRAGQNGALTLGEDVGDFVGLSFAHEAAFPSGTPDRKSEQEFFLQYARAWCGVERIKSAEGHMKTNPHALEYARVNEQVKQQPAFRRAFQCQASDRMVLPESELVKIW